MQLEHTILIATCVITILSVFFLVPKDKIREAWLIFLFKQTLTWCIGLYVVQKRWIEYPVRLFLDKASVALALNLNLFYTPLSACTLTLTTHKKVHH